MKMGLLFKNPVGRKKTTGNSRRFKKSRVITKRKKPTKRKISGALKKRVTRKKRRFGTASVPTPTPKATTTMGKYKRRKVSSVRRKTTMGRRRTTMGKGLNFSGIFDELLSLGSVAIGGFGGILASSYLTSMVFGEKNTNQTTVTYSDSILGGALTFAGLHFTEGYVKPSGTMNNLFQGAKIFSLFSILMKLKSLFIDGKEWNQVDYTVDSNTPMLAPPDGGTSRFDKALLGSSYYIDDTGTTYPLGASKITPTTMGASKITPTTMGEARSDINEAIDNMLSGSTIDAPNNYTPRGIDIGQKAFM